MALRLLLLLLAVAAAAVAVATLAADGARACAAHATCAACFKASGCGWCVTDGACMAGDNGGPSAPATCRGHQTGATRFWYFDRSQIIAQTAGFPVDPVATTVYLKQGEPLTVEVRVTPPLASDQLLDVMFLQDSSGSMTDDINTFRTLAGSLVNELLTLSKSPRVGLASFIEKPCAPNGYGPGESAYLLGDGTLRNYVYKLDQSLTPSAVQLQDALFNLSATGNKDYPEAAFEALGQVLTCDNIGWRDGARKVALVTTDAKFHHATDDWPSCVKQRPAWNGRCYGVRSGVKYGQVNNNYPSKAQIAALFRSTNVIPVFAVAHNPSDSTSRGAASELNTWRAFQENDVGYGITLPLTSDSSNLVTLIVEALRAVSAVITLAVAADGDPRQHVTAVTRSGGGTPARYEGVEPGNTRAFDVALLSSGPVVADTITLVSPGFGESAIDVVNVFPCRDCAGAANGTAAWDRCSQCAGDNSCVGCDDVAYSGKVNDACGNCGGNKNDATACGDCPTGTIDKCGVCDGADLCVGCDGVPFSNALYDLCGVCNGNDACIGCDGERQDDEALRTRVDRCGVCGLPSDETWNACVGCDDKAYPDGFQPVVDECGVCGGTNDCFCAGANDRSKKLDKCGACLAEDHPKFDECVGCDGEAYSGVVDDLCGVCAGFNECVSPCDMRPCVDGVADSCVRKDACQVCGGDGSSCLSQDNSTAPIPKVFNEPEAQPLSGGATAGIVSAVAVVVLLVIGVCLIAAFFVVQRIRNPNWLVPASLLSGMDEGVGSNPLYAGTGNSGDNPLYNADA